MTIASSPNANRVALLVAACAFCAWSVGYGMDLPRRKAGQWQITHTSDSPRIPVRVEEVCLDESTDALLNQYALGATGEFCGKGEYKSEGPGRYSVDRVCTMGATRMTIHGDTVFTGNTAYREEIRTHYDPPLRGRADSTSVSDGKWTGACAADMRPGDVVMRPTPAMPNGMRVNLTDTAKAPVR